MKKIKKLIFAPIALTAICVLSSCVDIGYNGGYNSIPVTYNATADGYFAEDSTELTKTTVKIMEVRRGAKWSNLIKGVEVPNNPTPSGDSGYEFKYWKVGNTKVDKITNDIVFDKPITLTAVFATTRRSFTADPWDIVIDYADMGYDALADYYKNDPDYVNNGRSFVGLTRHVDYAGKSRKVHVVAEKIDRIANSNNKAATLTFEFDELLPGYAYDSSASNSYTNSSLHSLLNSRIKNNLQDIVKEKCQQVVKTTNKGNGTSGKKNLESTYDYLFVPSLYEMNVRTNVMGYDTEREGRTYAYYAKDATDYDKQQRRQKYYYDQEGKKVYAPYWTRSPDTSINGMVWPVQEDGHIGLKDSTNYVSIETNTTLSIAPCFCIGQTTVPEEIRFETDSWENILKTANQGLVALRNRYAYDMEDNNDTFVGLTHPITLNFEKKGVQNYTVRVIGEKHDLCFDRGFAEYSALTLQFTSVVGQNENAYVDEFVNKNDSFYDYYDNVNYHRSMLSNCLDNVNTNSMWDTFFGSYLNPLTTTWTNSAGLRKSVYEMMPSALKSESKDTLGNTILGAREVLKYTMGRRAVLNSNWVLKGSSNDEPYDYHSRFRVFPLSYSEYGALLISEKRHPGYTTSEFIDWEDEPYAYYDYRKVTSAKNDEEKMKEVENRRIFNDKICSNYESKTHKGINVEVPKFSDSAPWSFAYLRSLSRYHKDSDGDYNFCMLHPTGEARDWSGMPRAESWNRLQDYNITNYRIGVVPAFSIGVANE